MPTAESMRRQAAAAIVTNLLLAIDFYVLNKNNNEISA
jgi:hypothetical protein